MFYKSIQKNIHKYKPLGKKLWLWWESSQNPIFSNVYLKDGTNL